MQRRTCSARRLLHAHLLDSPGRHRRSTSSSGGELFQTWPGPAEETRRASRALCWLSGAREAPEETPRLSPGCLARGAGGAFGPALWRFGGEVDPSSSPGQPLKHRRTALMSPSSSCPPSSDVWASSPPPIVQNKVGKILSLSSFQRGCQVSPDYVVARIEQTSCTAQVQGGNGVSLRPKEGTTGPPGMAAGILGG